MTASEMARVLGGSNEAAKRALFDALFNKAVSGTPLLDEEVPIFEALKKALIEKAPQVVEMSATMRGVAKAGA